MENLEEAAARLLEHLRGFSSTVSVEAGPSCLYVYVRAARPPRAVPAEWEGIPVLIRNARDL